MTLLGSQVKESKTGEDLEEWQSLNQYIVC